MVVVQGRDRQFGVACLVCWYVLVYSVSHKLIPFVLFLEFGYRTTASEALDTWEHCT